MVVCYRKVRYSLQVMQQNSSTPPTDETDSGIITSDTSREGWRSVLSTIFILALAPLIAWLMITFIFQSYEVDGPSMEETLHDKDRLIVLKTGKTLSRITDSAYIPNRYDVVVFIQHGLAELGSSQDKQLIKRVIGLPGDRVVINDGRVTIYNKEHPNGFDPDNGQAYAKTISHTSGNVDLTVAEGEVFVLGDNRENSLDSRNFGAVNSEELVGKLVFRLFPINKAESF